MINLQTVTDKSAIGLSLLCALHCSVVPFIAVALPTTAVLPLQNEAFHFWMVVAVLPISVYALTLGCKQHKRLQLLGMGLAGLSCLIAAVLLGEAVLGEVGEKTLTLLGAAIIAAGHYRNYTLCKKSHRCDCTENET